MKKIQKGFTLIELLIVIAIIGILSSTVLISLNSARQKARDTHITTDIKQLKTQLESEYSFNYNSSFTAESNIIKLGNADINYQVLFEDIHNNTASSTASTTELAGYTLPADTYPEFVVVYPSGITATGSTINGSIDAYALYGKLSDGVATYFCLDSAGNNIEADYSTAPFNITCQ